MEQRVHNFSAGPAALPLPVMEQAQREFLVYPGAGASIMEISHRSKQFAEVHEEAKANVAKLLGLDDEFQVLFFPGGATMQFSALPMNFMAGKPAVYIDCGSWAAKALKEAKKFGDVHIGWSGKEAGYVAMPDAASVDVPQGAAYVHMTSNETIEGIEFLEDLDFGDTPVFCDASSDFLSRPLDMSKYDVIYAGAQKNVGPSGMAVVVVRKSLLERVPENLPALLDYKTMADKDSLYNTPPTFPIYIVGLAAKWLLEEKGGLAEIEKVNIAKAKKVYAVIDGSGGFYKGHAEPAHRSRMNVTFRLGSEDLEAKFVAEATAAGLHGLKGHRSVGGCRASIYNAMSAEGIDALCAFMQDFQRNNG